MKSRATPSFWRALGSLSPTDRRAAKRAFKLFSEDPFHGSLRFKKLAGHEALWSARVTLSVRAVGMRDGEIITWVWVGTHGEFDSRFG